MKKRHLKNNKGLVISVFVIGTLILTSLFFQIFNKKVTPKLVMVAKYEFSKMVNTIASSQDVLNLFADKTDNLLKISKNSKGEILTVDYQMQDIYKLSNQITKELLREVLDENRSNLSPYLANNQKYNHQDTLLFMLPMGIASDYIFLNNLGPKLPVVIHFIDSVYTNVQTKITNYGINNALVELYLDITLKYDLITPVVGEGESLNYTMLIDARIIEGRVPEWFGDEMITNSSDILNNE